MSYLATGSLFINTSERKFIMSRQTSNRAEKKHKFGTPKMNNYKTKNKDFQMFMHKNIGELNMRGFENLKHQELRELQRYGTANIDEKEMVKLICNGNAIPIKEDEETMTLVVKYLNRYYVPVVNKKYKFIKTYLPDTIENFLDYVQQLIDIEKPAKILLAA